MRRATLAVSQGSGGQCHDEVRPCALDAAIGGLGNASDGFGLAESLFDPLWLRQFAHAE